MLKNHPTGIRRLRTRLACEEQEPAGAFKESSSRDHAAVLNQIREQVNRGISRLWDFATGPSLRLFGAERRVGQPNGTGRPPDAAENDAASSDRAARVCDFRIACGTELTSCATISEAPSRPSSWPRSIRSRSPACGSSRALPSRSSTCPSYDGALRTSRSSPRIFHTWPWPSSSAKNMLSHVFPAPRSCGQKVAADAAN